jgi:hypothetical protein
MKFGTRHCTLIANFRMTNAVLSLMMLNRGVTTPTASDSSTEFHGGCSVMDGSDRTTVEVGGGSPQSGIAAELHQYDQPKDPAAASLHAPASIDPNCQAILKNAQWRRGQFFEAQQIFYKAAARTQRAWEAWLEVAEFKGPNIPRELRGPALWRAYAERIVLLGQVLNEDDWQEQLDAVQPGSQAKTYALAILRRAMAGDLEGVLSMLTSAGDVLFELGFAADQWLRDGLRYEVLGIEPAPVPPRGWEGSYFEPVETVADFVRWIDQQFSMQDFLGAKGDQPGDGSLIRDAFRLVMKLQLAGMPSEPYGPFTLGDELAVLRNLRRCCAAANPEVRHTKPTAENCSGITPETKVGRLLTQQPNAQIADVQRVTGLSALQIRRTQAWKDHEARLLGAYLLNTPDAGTLQVKGALGFAPSKTVTMPAWQHHRQRQLEGKSLGEVKTRPLGRAMLECRIDEKASPPDAGIMQRDELLRAILETAAPQIRGKLNALSDTDRKALVEYLKLNLDGRFDADEDQAAKLELIMTAVESWLDQQEDQRRAQRTERRSAG